MTVGNNRVSNIVGTNGEATVNSNGRKTDRFFTFNNLKIMKKNSVALVRERTIPTERPPPVGEVSVNFCG